MKEQPIQRAKFIYNPHAGEKRRLNPMQKKVALEDVKALLEQYQIPVDPTPTKYPKHATELAKDSIKEGYKTVIVAGGDGTVGEVINGLVGSDVVIGILPLGSVMNNARMFGIPLELEKAVELIKIRRERKIDVGGITKLNGEKMEETYYFTEQSGIGFDAIMHYYTSTLFDKHMYGNIFRILKTFLQKHDHLTELIIDGEKLTTKATLISVSNGPLGGPALALSPKAKLNDHKLTVTLYDMGKYELLRHLFRAIGGKQPKLRKIKSIPAENVKILTEVPKLVHADARIYGETPVEFRVKPGAVTIISGFPPPEHSAFRTRTYLDL